MDGDWLSRLGVLGEGLAFVFLAPEILGPRRLRRAEAFLEARLPRISSFLSFDELQVRSWGRYAVLSLLGTAPWIGVLLISLLLPIPFMLGALAILAWTFVGFWLGVIGDKLGMAPGWKGLWLIIFVGSWFAGVLVVHWVVRLVINRFVAVLSGGRRLRSVVFWLGAALFAMGITAQFVATF